jgi:hypothetical protein
MNIPIELHKRKDTHFLKLNHISLVSLMIAKYHFRFYDIKPLAITISFIAFTTSVNVNNGNRWKQENKHGSNGSSKANSVKPPYDT